MKLALILTILPGVLSFSAPSATGLDAFRPELQTTAEKLVRFVDDVA